jgi:formylglycine-generating enzyme required for sulfatase activity
MVFLEGGTFTMGDIIEEKNEDALPLHPVTLGDYYIGRYEVTYEQYAAYAQQANLPIPPSELINNADRPMTYVSWYEAEAYCNYFGWRLPSENEWEYAARSKGKAMQYAGTNHSDSLSKYAFTASSHLANPQIVGSLKPNKAGLFDMSGNVYEWIGAYYQYYEDPSSWHNLEESSMRIIRGGSIGGYPGFAQTYWRVGVLGKAQEYDIGFRCAVTQEELNSQRFLGGFFHSKPIRP